ncbi:uncharacterized protein [Labrus bergylta]|uniref:uncharacterized protein n=1 Tax=Labrus bergylta TaxID=56723 RepID=UPI00331326F2
MQIKREQREQQTHLHLLHPDGKTTCSLLSCLFFSADKQQNIYSLVSQRTSSNMIRLLVFLSLLAGLAVVDAISYNTDQFKVTTSKPFYYFGKQKSSIYVSLNTTRTAICFDGYISSKTNQDCFFINVPTNSSTSVLEINKNLAANFRRYLPSSFNVNAVNFIMKLFFKSGSKNFEVLIISGNGPSIVLSNPMNLRTLEYELLVGGRTIVTKTISGVTTQDTSSCRSSKNTVLFKGQRITDKCRVEHCRDPGLISTNDCGKYETCQENKCIFDAICTFTGPSIISADGLTGNITDRCDYHFFSISKPNFIQVDGNYGTRRRTDVSFLDTVVIRLPGSAAYYLEQGGRVKAGDRVLNLTTPKVSGSLKISKNEKGVTAFFQTNTLNASVYFDGYTAQIHLHGGDQTYLRINNLCSNINYINNERIASDGSCQNVQTDKADPSLNCPKAKKRCGVLREDPFTRCHAIIAPDSYIKVCEETLCSYPSVDNLPCHYLEAYARACSLMGVPELSGWGQKSNCPTTHEALCQDKFCASHEFCGETEANGLGCLCQSAFAAPYRQNKTFGNATTCYRNSASASLINCLLMERGFDYTTLHLKDPKCIGELQDGVLTFSFNNTEMCKTEVMDSDTQVIYTNTITSSESNDPIIRQDEIALNFSCSYAQPPIKTLSFKIQSSSVVSEIKSGIWQYSLTMKAYSDAGLQQTATLVTLNQKIWVELKTAGLDSNLVAVVIDSCWANKNKESDKLPKYNLIKAGCANPKDKSVKVEGNGEGTSSVFSFNMFQFAKSAADVFLHCKVNLCGKKDKSCAPVCTSKRRRSARNMYLGAPALITMAWTS